MIHHIQKHPEKIHYSKTIRMHDYNFENYLTVIQYNFCRILKMMC